MHVNWVVLDWEEYFYRVALHVFTWSDVFIPCFFFSIQMSLIQVDWFSICKHQDLMIYESEWLQLKKKKKEHTNRNKRTRHLIGVTFPHRL